MANALGPYFVSVKYHSPQAPHTMTLPTKNWAGGNFDTWAGGSISDLTMIQSLITLMLPYFNSDVAFDNYTIYRQLLPADFPQPVASANFTGYVGTDVGATWAEAVETIIVARTESFGIAKLSMLDSVSDDDFTPITAPRTKETNLLAEWFDPTNGWSGRDNAKPDVFLKLTKNLNQKLRKEYRLD